MYTICFQDSGLFVLNDKSSYQDSWQVFIFISHISQMLVCILAINDKIKGGFLTLCAQMWWEKPFIPMNETV